jgi:hypothetical protein
VGHRGLIERELYPGAEEAATRAVRRRQEASGGWERTGGHSGRVPNLALTWQQGAGLAAGLAVLAAATRYSRGAKVRTASPIAGEAAVIAALYALWQLAGTLSVSGTNGAFARARWIMRFQRDVHLPSELDVQRWVLPHRWLGEFCNLYYASVHFAALGALLLWVFLRHRDAYPRLRLTVVLLTASCLLIQLIPVAPPRLLPQYGFVDLAQRYGQSVYAGTGVDSLSAMPSVHVGWAVLVGLTAVRVSRSRWRWWVLAHPIVTIFVVIATANHFWLDGIVAVALLALAELAQSAIGRAVVAVRAGRRQAELVPSL